MIVTTKILALFGAGIASDAVAAAQQRVMLYGTLQTESECGAAAPLRSASVFFDADDASIGPLRTDDRGHFAFYDTNRGSYRLRVFLEGGQEPVLMQTVMVPERPVAAIGA